MFNDSLIQLIDNRCHCRQAYPSHLGNGEVVIASSEAIQTNCKSTFGINRALCYRSDATQYILKCCLGYAKCFFNLFSVYRSLGQFSSTSPQHDIVWHRGLYLYLLKIIPDVKLVKFIMLLIQDRTFVLETSNGQRSAEKETEERTPPRLCSRPNAFQHLYRRHASR